MNEPTQRKFPLTLIAIAMAAMVGGIWSALQLQRPAPTAAPMTAVTVLPTPRQVADVQMLDQNEATFERKELEGQWSLLFLGFTNCGHVCPMTMAKMRMIHDGVAQPLNVIFVSVDPNRDTPAVIKTYVENYDASFTGITGEPAEVDKLANSLGAPYFVDTNPDNYIVDHSSALFLIDPEAALVGIISQPLEIDQVVQELNDLM